MLKGKTALVTGSGRGIGRATAQLLAERGAKVAVCARTAGEVDETVKLIAAKGGVAKGFTCDVSDEAQVKKLFEGVQREFGGLDILVNNAGVFGGTFVANTSLEEFNRVFAVNTAGVFLCCREAFNLMKGKGGSIVNVSSLAGVQGVEKFPGFGAYTVSKFGVVGLTEVLAVEGKKYGIRANVVAPGAVNTAMLHSAFPNSDFVMLSPEQVASAIAFLAGPESSGVSGVVLPLHSDLLKG